MFELNVESDFSAAHQLRAYRGKCEKLHGHNWRVKLRVAGEDLGDEGMLVDFKELNAWLKRALERLDHAFLNDVPPFDTINPTSENLARYIAESVGANLPPAVRVAQVTVWESDRCSATYRP